MENDSTGFSNGLTSVASLTLQNSVPSSRRRGFGGFATAPVPSAIVQPIPPPQLMSPVAIPSPSVYFPPPPLVQVVTPSLTTSYSSLPSSQQNAEV